MTTTILNVPDELKAIPTVGCVGANEENALMTNLQKYLIKLAGTWRHPRMRQLGILYDAVYQGLFHWGL